MARDEPNKRAHSEHVADTASERQKEERSREHAREKPKPESDGKKPHELRTTSKTGFDRHIEEKDGQQVARTSEEMSLHDELDRTRVDDDKKGDQKDE